MRPFLLKLIRKTPQKIYIYIFIFVIYIYICMSICSSIEKYTPRGYVRIVGDVSVLLSD